jgi:hypothetical protein
MTGRTIHAEASMTISFDCPWCGDPLSAEASAPDARCDACAIQVDLADPAPLPLSTPVAAAA